MVLNAVDGADKMKWEPLKKRRLQQWGGTPQPEGMRVESLPQFVDAIINTLMVSAVFPEHKKPNHALINEYNPGEVRRVSKPNHQNHPFQNICCSGNHAF